MNIKEQFTLIEGIDSFQRVDDTHILDLYIGIDNMSRWTLFMKSEFEPSKIYSSKIISVQVGFRNDNMWGVSFSLASNHFDDVFCHFCSDIIESSRNISNRNEGTAFVCARYVDWQNMLAKSNDDLLSGSSIKGLIGEILFLKNFLFPLYGQELSINSWIGPEQADQDFVCGSFWYEIKSTVCGSESVRISSVEQLDVDIPGELAIVYLDRTSHSDSSKITLNSIFSDVYALLETKDLKQKFYMILLNFGYRHRDEYDEYMYKFDRIERYYVDFAFPCVRRANLPHSVLNASYSLSISSISAYLKG